MTITNSIARIHCPLILLLVLLISSCKLPLIGDDDDESGPSGSTQEKCANSPLVGDWVSSITEETLKLSKHCEFKYNYCGSTGDFPNINSNSGELILKINSVSAAMSDNCLPVGEHICDFEISNNNNSLYIDCNGSYSYFDKVGTSSTGGSSSSAGGNSSHNGDMDYGDMDYGDMDYGDTGACYYFSPGDTGIGWCMGGVSSSICEYDFTPNEDC